MFQLQLAEAAIGFSPVAAHNYFAMTNKKSTPGETKDRLDSLCSTGLNGSGANHHLAVGPLVFCGTAAVGRSTGLPRVTTANRVLPKMGRYPRGTYAQG